MLLVMTATIGITFSIQASFADRRAADVALRILLAVASLLVLFHPDERIAALACIPVAGFVGYWILRRRHVPVGEAGPGGMSADLDAKTASADGCGRALAPQDSAQEQLRPLRPR
jgi:hypothetical protein